MMSRLSGFKSRWMIPWLCKYRIPCKQPRHDTAPQHNLRRPVTNPSHLYGNGEHDSGRLVRVWALEVAKHGHRAELGYQKHALLHATHAIARQHTRVMQPTQQRRLLEQLVGVATAS